MADMQELRLKIVVDKDTGNIKVVQGEVEKLSGSVSTQALSFTKLAGAVGLGNLAFTSASQVISEVTGFLKDSIKEAEEEIIIQRRLDVQLRSVGLSWKENKRSIEDWAIITQQTTRFSKDEMLTALSGLLKYTGDLKVAQDWLNISTKQAVRDEVPLAQVTADVTRALISKERGIRILYDRFGTLVDKTKSVKENFELLKKKFEELGTEEDSHILAVNQLSNNWKEFKGNIGNMVIPILDKVIEKLAKITAPKTPRQFAEDLAKTNPAIKEYLGMMDDLEKQYGKVEKAGKKVKTPAVVPDKTEIERTKKYGDLIIDIQDKINKNVMSNEKYERAQIELTKQKRINALDAIQGLDKDQKDKAIILINAESKASEDAIKNQKKMWEDLGDTIANKMTDSITEIINSGEGMETAFFDIGTQIVREFETMIVKALILRAIMASTRMGAIPAGGDILTAIMGHASGGTINEPLVAFGKSGAVHTFGESGPERITPIGTNRTTNNYSRTASININIGAFAGSKNELDKFTKILKKAQQDIDKRGEAY